MDRAEHELKTSRFVLRDAALNAYVHDIVCRLGKEHCPDLRVYVVRTPQFNASMAPNGMMQVWTGLLLRCSDEAQLAAIIGHEMGHYLRRHSIERWRDARDKADVGAFLSLGLSAAGVGWAGGMTNLALIASIFAYSRDNEREADEIGLQLMRKAGYAPVAAAEVWSQLIAELEAGTAERAQNLLFATHPEPEERIVALRAAAEAATGESGGRGHARYLDRLAGVRKSLVRDELALRQYGRSERVFDRLLVRSPDDGLLWYAKGEVYRLRGEAGDPDRAAAAYAKALAVSGAPAETYRSIVLIELKRGDRARAQEAFTSYLARVPDAADAGALRMLISQ
ncbi:MAG: M48 family metalloprotease [Burkholderiales bacterium]|nr:M48 family metalloprotease [Burkholderiales bacterium]